MTTASEIAELRFLAQEDARKAEAYKVDLNPYRTANTRGMWAAGFEGTPPPQPNAEGSYYWRAWERGRQARILADERSATCPEHGQMLADAAGTPEQAWCGSWYRCNRCTNAVLIPSADLRAAAGSPT